MVRMVRLMKYSKATNYALHIVQALYRIPVGESRTVSDLVAGQEVSPTYLSKILTKLSKADILEAVSGVKGGYRINQSFGDITMLDVIHAIEGSSSMFNCSPSHGPNCTIYQIMLESENRMEEYLNSIKIKDIS